MPKKPPCRGTFTVVDDPKDKVRPSSIETGTTWRTMKAWKRRKVTVIDKRTHGATLGRPAICDFPHSNGRSGQRWRERRVRRFPT